MTALVGILNKRAVAVAADSAVTVTSAADGSKKIYNTAQKIFRLAEAQPVGVMIYNNVEFMQTPWDVLIKLYHDRHGQRNLPTLKAYKEDFVRFLHDHHFFTSEAEQRAMLTEALRTLVRKVYESAMQEYEQAHDDKFDDLPLAAQKPYYEKWTAALIAGCHDDGLSAAFADYTCEAFRAYADVVLTAFYAELRQADIPADPAMWEPAFYAFLCSQRMWDYTGLVFVGYGSEQIYPALYEMAIDIGFDGRLRTLEGNESYSVITSDNSSEIMSFAQDDVIRTLLKGLAPDIKAHYDDAILDALDGMGPEVAHQKMRTLESINVTIDATIGDEYICGLYRSVAFFNVQDMATMAESLISITNLQRHFTSSEESVGGPIDVAVITRSEGFTWVKHKNQQQ